MVEGVLGGWKVLHRRALNWMHRRHGLPPKCCSRMQVLEGTHLAMREALVDGVSRLKRRMVAGSIAGRMSGCSLRRYLSMQVDISGLPERRAYQSCMMRRSMFRVQQAMERRQHAVCH